MNPMMKGVVGQCVIKLAWSACSGCRSDRVFDSGGSFLTMRSTFSKMENSFLCFDYNTLIRNKKLWSVTFEFLRAIGFFVIHNSCCLRQNKMCQLLSACVFNATPFTHSNTLTHCETINRAMERLSFESFSFKVGKLSCRTSICCMTGSSCN
jgi:hypothetical protein